MSTKLCVFNEATKLIDITPGVAVYTGSSADAYAPITLNAAGALDSSFFSASTPRFASEVPAGTAPTTIYMLTHVPTFIFSVYKNGQFMYPGNTYDYLYVPGDDIITFNYTTEVDDVIWVVYAY